MLYLIVDFLVSLDVTHGLLKEVGIPKHTLKKSSYTSTRLVRVLCMLCVLHSRARRSANCKAANLWTAWTRAYPPHPAVYSKVIKQGQIDLKSSGCQFVRPQLTIRPRSTKRVSSSSTRNVHITHMYKWRASRKQHTVTSQVTSPKFRTSHLNPCPPRDNATLQHSLSELCVLLDVLLLVDHSVVVKSGEF